MKAILEFNLPEEYTAYRHTVDGISAHVALSEITQELRRMSKHGLPGEEEGLLAALKVVWDAINDNGLSIE